MKGELFETKPVPVVARRVLIDEYVNVRGRMTLAQAGTWVVHFRGGVEGSSLIVPDDVFREAYTPRTAMAEDMLGSQGTSRIYVPGA